MNGQLDTRRALGGDFLSDRPVSNAPNTGWNDARLPGNQTVESIVAFFRVDLKIGRRLKRLRDVTDVCLGKHDGQELVVARPSPVQGACNDRALPGCAAANFLRGIAAIAFRVVLRSDDQCER